MRHGSLFSGIGGFDLAAESMGWTNVFHCEWMPFPRKVLSHYWPEATSYHDITTTDFSVHRGEIDILTGGFPCQPYSAAGKRKGKDDDRHLWPHMLRCIREVRPRWMVGENVFGLVTWNAGMVFEEVCADLESEGYSVQPFVLPAAAVNAGSGLLPTPAANERGTLTYSKESQSGRSLTTLAIVGMLPTPKAQEARGNASVNRGKYNLTDEIAARYKPTSKSSQLSPRFVAEMMGFPTNWTELPFQSGETNQ